MPSVTPQPGKYMQISYSDGLSIQTFELNKNLGIYIGSEFGNPVVEEVIKDYL